jgi:uncharacterized membrane protein
MKNIEQYVNSLFNEIPDSENKTQLRNEIIENLEEKVADLMADGKSEEDAINKAIVEFGDISDIKDELMSQQHLSIKKSNAGLSLGFSICGTVLIIALFIFIDIYYTPHIIWCVFPIFAVLWWPLSMLYHWLKIRRK